ncbi:hypothetical protein RN001_005186 [Aquatica leii]|uniref:Uncharacterized protein n=1 Tax=Aquatica leii TaxID=1421715 RepID=A0AAN7SHS4_9COLE|nr:hypothetical protein RN001_005186 [Aquatica leii]
MSLCTSKNKSGSISTHNSPFWTNNRICNWVSTEQNGEVLKSNEIDLSNDKQMPQNIYEFQEEESMKKFDSDKRILIHQVVTIKAPLHISEINQVHSNINDFSTTEASETDGITKEIENKKLESQNQNNVDICQTTPEDPFQTSGDSDSTYVPTEDNDSVCTSHSPSINKNINKKVKNTLVTRSKTKSEMYAQLSIESINSISADTGIAISQKQCFTPNIVEQETKNENVTESTIVLEKPKQSALKVAYIRKPDYCYFCETEVFNFARHITRNHSSETTVLEIMSKPIKSKDRRYLLDNLRRKGNFLASSSKCFKPVRKTYVMGRSVLPCDNCLGFFSSKLLHRHRKKCLGEKCKGNAQAAGQSMLVINSRVCQRLKTEVFPHMRADKVSIEAKNDPLICAFGSRYLATHREKHFVHVTSRKMRELSKVLIEMRKLEPAITNMLSTLQPRFFDHFVEATKRISRYDPEKDIYLSPTFAMNISTSIKQCCDIAIAYNYKKSNSHLSVSSSEIEANLKTLIHLFKSSWKFEISSQAGNNLNINKWNKITIIPLASDLKLLRDFLIEKAENASLKLKNNRDVAAYNTLVESVFCRVILLNRKRSGELQRMYLHTYVNSSSDKQKYEEFNKIVSPTEEILLKTLKRVVIRGKRGRGVPVLFSVDVQNHIRILLEGKSLDEVNIDMDRNLLSIEDKQEDKSDDSEDEQINDDGDLMNSSVPAITNNTEDASQPIANVKIGKHRTLIPWSTEQKKVVKVFFKKHIKTCKPPKRQECEELKSKYSELLKNKNWLKIKVFVQNEYNKTKKNSGD